MNDLLHDDPLRPPRLRVALTGGPGGGKTTAADLLRRELGERVVIVPETATMLFAGGFPRSREPHARCSAQSAIYHVQTNLEDIQTALFPDRVLLCDRGTLDGAVYWPDDPLGFFAAVGTTLERELARYDEVLFFETAAVGGMGIEGGNPTRIETLEEAVALDAALRELWCKHPRFTLLEHEPSFLKKMTSAVAILGGIVSRLDARMMDAQTLRRG
jgi:predicted ATPase